MDQPKPRPLTLDSQVVAYLGDYMKIYKESITRLVKSQINTLNTQAQSPVSQLNTASSRGQS